ncbi:cysteinyl leukotriene receptor 1 [Ornithorhynchus anatinus]|uniref:Cysteinyl leukotriene receptor 1 n=1 Tax=Ornithorhynchus anatinus TaxID=9258 RepID=A0A6I8NA62_ORNAN|nr:cysteinyl leukotriene receptor 1 [Ornithorhynchus anatinus]
MDGAANTTLPGVNASCPETIDDFRNQVYSTVYSAITVVGLLGNGFVLYVLLKTYHEKSAFQVYLVNLALSDLLFVSTLPLRVVYYVHRGSWFFGDLLCRLSTYMLYVNLYCSIFFMTAMSFFRCVAIVFPVQNMKLVTQKKARWVCACIWAFVILTSSPFLASGSHVDKYNKTKCFEPPQSSSSLSSLLILHFVAVVLGFLLPFLVITICYTMISWTLLKNSLKKNQADRRKAVGMILVVTAAFLMCFTPYHVQRSVYLLSMVPPGQDCMTQLRMQKSVVITLALAATNCCFDPLLYFFSGGNFRRKLSTFRKHSWSSMTSVPKRRVSLQDQCGESFKE